MQNITAAESNVSDIFCGIGAHSGSSSLKSEYDDVYPEGSTAMFYATLIIKYFAGLLSSVTSVLAITTWIMSPRWRTFQNLVYLNMLFCSLMTYLVLPVIRVVIIAVGACDITFETYWTVPKTIFHGSYICWILIASIVTYMDVVIVFFVNVSRKRLKCYLFADGIPLLISLVKLCYILTKHRYLLFFPMCVAVLLLLSNVLIYVRVLYSLCQITGSISSTKYRQKVQVATVIFFMSGSMMLPAVVLGFLKLIQDKSISFVTLTLCRWVFHVQKIIVNVCFLLLKANRGAWKELCYTKSDSNYTDNFRKLAINVY